jgi:hypothetical protein
MIGFPASRLSTLYNALFSVQMNMWKVCYGFWARSSSEHQPATCSPVAAGSDGDEHRFLRPRGVVRVVDSAHSSDQDCARLVRRVAWISAAGCSDWVGWGDARGGRVSVSLGEHRRHARHLGQLCWPRVGHQSPWALLWWRIGRPPTGSVVWSMRTARSPTKQPLSGSADVRLVAREWHEGLTTMLKTKAQVGRRYTLTWAFVVERVRGIEPPSRAWEALILPLNYTRSTAKPSTGSDGYPRRSRTVSAPS